MSQCVWVWACASSASHYFPHPSATVTHHFLKMSKFPLGEQERYLVALESSIPDLIFGLHSYK